MINVDGRIDNLVDDSLLAWHAGVSNWNGKDSVNKNSIGIELINPGSGTECCFKLAHEACPDFNITAECVRNPFQEPQLSALISLITCLKEEHKAVTNNNIVAHGDVAPARKMDPGIMFPWNTLCEHGIGICSSKSDSDEPIDVLYKFGDENKALHTVKTGLQKLGYGYIDNSTNIFDSQLSYAVRAFHFHHNKKIEDAGYWGDWTTLDDLILCDLLGSCSSDNAEGKVEL
jgi:N-acetylmuramoyl-L-alanine amidase